MRNDNGLGIHSGPSISLNTSGLRIISSTPAVDRCITPAKKRAKRVNGLKTCLTSGYILHQRCKTRAKKKSQPFGLTVDDCANLAPCEYCGGEATGFDRVDSELGYVLDNVVPACAACNTMKLRMTVPEFMAHIRVVLAKYDGNA